MFCIYCFQADRILLPDGKAEIISKTPHPSWLALPVAGAWSPSAVEMYSVHPTGMIDGLSRLVCAALAEGSSSEVAINRM